MSFHTVQSEAEGDRRPNSPADIVQRHSNKVDMPGRQSPSYHSSPFVCMENNTSHTLTLILRIDELLRAPPRREDDTNTNSRTYGYAGVIRPSQPKFFFLTLYCLFIGKLL